MRLSLNMLLTNNVEFLLFKFAVDISHRIFQAKNDWLICRAQTEIYEWTTLILVCLIRIINFRFAWCTGNFLVSRLSSPSATIPPTRRSSFHLNYSSQPSFNFFMLILEASGLPTLQPYTPNPSIGFPSSSLPSSRRPVRLSHFHHPLLPPIDFLVPSRRLSSHSPIGIPISPVPLPYQLSFRFTNIPLIRRPAFPSQPLPPTHCLSHLPTTDHLPHLPGRSFLPPADRLPRLKSCLTEQMNVLP